VTREQKVKPGWNWADGIFLLLAAGAFSTAMILGGILLYGALGCLAVLTVAAIREGRTLVFHAMLLCAIITAFEAIAPARLSLWPLRLLVPLLAYICIGYGVPRFRCPVSWMKVGKLDSNMLRAALVVVVLAGLALPAWYFWLSAGRGQYAGRIPAIPLWMLPLAGIGFATANAAMEEAIFRGIMLESLETGFQSVFVPVLLQAIMFGALHFRQGFPGGASGVLLASIYGLMLGLLRRKSSGMLLPWTVHILADIEIFAILAIAARS
jgi:hypothetical protein